MAEEVAALQGGGQGGWGDGAQLSEVVTSVGTEPGRVGAADVSAYGQL